jgi:hypothetical protein
LANANAGTPLNPNLTTQQLWNEFYQIVTQPKSDIESIIANQLMKFMYAPPAPGGAGADKQVIFNDGGVLAGDPQFLWNKTTNLLTVTGSATITGDLTVDTSTLKVDSANNRVGIGTASPTYPFDVVGTGRFVQTNFADNIFRLSTGGSTIGNINQILFADQATTATSAITAYNSAFGSGKNYALGFTTNGSERYLIDSTGISTWSVGGSNAMTLNSTGLGVGVSPAYKGDFNGNIRSMQQGDRTNLAFLIDSSASPSWAQRNIIGHYYNTAYSQDALSIRSPSSSLANTASYDIISTGAHLWFLAGGSTANASTGTQAMTLDASGNLLVGTTNTSASAGVGFKANYSATVPAFSVVVNDAAGTGAAYTLYNTNAAAYRFYVSNGGTIFATNTTISGISDARLKENVEDIDVGLGAILALKPRKFDWKAGKGKDIKGDRGFIAQEFETVFPNLIDEWKDESPEGEAPYKSVRQDLIPVLVKAIQELTARVQTLETR